MQDRLLLRRPSAAPPAESARKMDHRWGRRRPTKVAVYIIAQSGARGAGRVANVSMTGAYLETQMTLRPFSLVYLEPVNMASGGPSGKRVAAGVVRHDARGVGLEWCEPQTKAADVNALLTALGGVAVDESIGVYDRHYRPEGGGESRSQTAWMRNS
jgi:hypothetical protein